MYTVGVFNFEGINFNEESKLKECVGLYFWGFAEIIHTSCSGVIVLHFVDSKQ